MTGLPVISVAGRDLDVNSLPEKSVAAILRRGFTHYFGSEIASKVKAKKDKHLEEHKVEMTEQEIDTLKALLVEDGFAKLLAGTLGDRAVGQSIDPVEALIESKARAEVKDMLRVNGVKVPKAGETIKTPDGAEYTLDELVERRLSNADHKARLEKEAKKDIAAKAKAKASLKVEGVVNSLADLGL